jgi:hypothetical protein
MIKIFNKSISNYLLYLPDSAKDEIESEIEELLDLQAGWHFGEGVPPSNKTIVFAKDVYRSCKHLGLKTKVFPSPNGGVVIVFYGKGNHCVEISVDENNAMTVSYEIGYGFEFTESFYKENATLNDAKQQCKKLIILKNQNLSESFTQGYLIHYGEGSQAIVSKIRPATEGFPLLTYTALDRLIAPQFANM